MGTRIHRHPDHRQATRRVGDTVHDIGEWVVTALFWLGASAAAALLLAAGVLALTHIIGILH